MDSPAPQPTTGIPVNWRTVAIVAALALVAWWVWTHQGATVPEVRMQSNATPPPLPPTGVPITLVTKMARVVDTSIPVIMTSGTEVQYAEDEVTGIVRSTLKKLNAMDEYVSLVQVVSASKTIDAYKTVSYDIEANVYDARENVGLKVLISAIVPVSGTTYIRQFRLATPPASADQGPPAADGAGSSFAPFEDPVRVLAAMRLPA